MTTSERFDDISSVLASTIAARQYGTEVLGPLGALSARTEYAVGGLLARIVDLQADTAVEKGVTVMGADDALYAEFDRLKVLKHLGDALRWSLLDGGSALIMLAKDVALLSEALDTNGLQQIEEFRIITLDQIKPSAERYADPSRPNFGMPIAYEIKPASGQGQPYIVHESRLIEIPGAPMAGSVFDGKTGGNRVPWAGRGFSSRAIEAISRYRRCVKWGEKLLERSQQAVHSMKGLAEMLRLPNGTGEAVVRKRIDLVDSNRSALNGVAVDSEDSYTITSASVAGAKDVIQEAQVAVAAEVGLPVTILFGRSPGGLNATGDSDWDVLYERVQHLQKDRLLAPLERIVSLIAAQKTSPPPLDNEWSIEFNPLAVLNDVEQANIENKQADTHAKIAAAVNTLVTTQVLSQDEAHAYLANQRLFGLDPDEAAATGAAAYAAQT